MLSVFHMRGFFWREHRNIREILVFCFSPKSRQFFSLLSKLSAASVLGVFARPASAASPAVAWVWAIWGNSLREVSMVAFI